MKHSAQSRKQLRAAGLIALAALLLAACGNIQSPEGWAAPVSIDGRLLVQSDRGQFSLVEPGGAVLWRYPAEDRDGDNPFYATPVVDGSVAYIADYAGRVTRLEVEPGLARAAWSVDLEAPVVATPLLRGNALYVPTETGRIEVLDTADGTVRQTVRTSDRRIWGSPAADGGSIFVGDLDSGVTIAFDAASGDQLWEQEISGATAADLALDRDLLLVGSFDRAVHALDIAAQGAERWAFDGDGWFMGRPLVSGNIVYAASMRGSVYALDRDTGAQRWAYTAPEDAEFRAAPVIVGDHLVAVARDGRIFALSLGDGSLAWTADALVDGNVNANPYVDGSNIYLVTSKHDLVRVDAANNGATQRVPLASAN